MLAASLFLLALLPEPDADIQGRVRAASSGDPVAHATVRLPELRRTVSTDGDGNFVIRGVPDGRWRVQASALGYHPTEAVVRVAGTATVRIDFDLETAPVALTPVEARGRRGQAPAAEGHGAAAERALYEQEVVPGVVGVSAQEIRSVPALGETDVLRALQALPGVVTLNDLSAELHVRGGASDQNLFLLDGARVFAPYHLFGLFGAFNSDAIARAEFFRGAFPARYGGALSSVVELEQRGGAEAGTRVDGGVGMLGARVTAAGALPWARGRWLLAGRRSHADVVVRQMTRDTFPYSFHDLQGRLSLDPAPGHQVRTSWFASADRYRMFLDGESTDLHSRWKNAVGSAAWDWSGGGGRSASVTAWHSRYSGSLVIGAGPAAAATDNRIAISGLRAEFRREGARTDLRAGVEVEGGRVEIAGTDSIASYVAGGTAATHFLPAAYLEADHRLGRLRLTPGMRLAHDGRGGELLVEPRLAARFSISEDLAVTVGAARAHQVLASLRDERFVLPGPPLWVRLPAHAPASRTDGVSAALEGWRGGAWSYRVEAYARRFEGVARWMPAGSRQLSTMEFVDGGASGLELFARRHEGRLSGWASYAYSRARLRAGQPARPYEPAWDRRHSAEAVLSWQARSNVVFSGRSTYGSGLPFWPFIGYVNSPRFDPMRGQPDERKVVPDWADTQMRYPDYFRMDLAARATFRVRGVRVEPVLSVQNVTARPNVLYYDLVPQGSAAPMQLVPKAPFPLPAIPSLGIDVHF